MDWTQFGQEEGNQILSTVFAGMYNFKHYRTLFWEGYKTEGTAAKQKLNYAC